MRTLAILTILGVIAAVFGLATAEARLLWFGLGLLAAALLVAVLR